MSLTVGGIITMLLSQILPIEEVGPVVDAVVLILSTVMIWWGRYRLGDITWWGGRK